VLAQRLKKILSKLINEDQTGYIKNRCIGFNLRQIQDIIDYAHICKIEGSLVFIDFKKAFDSLEWDFMLLTLKRFGFNNSFVGIYFGHDKEECEKLNWENKIEKMNNLLLLWSKINLTILGKILIIKSFIFPIFTYVASACVVPEKHRKEIDSKCFKFIWNNKPDKVKRNTVEGKLGIGGLKMIDIQSYFMSLNASWVSRLVSNQLVNWKVILCKYFEKLGKQWLVFSQNLDNITVNKYAKQIPEFYGEVLRSWNKIEGGQTRTPLNFADVRKQIIWGNKLIKFDHKTLLFNNWINSDLIYVNDILDEHGEISHNFILNRLNNKSNWITEFTIMKKAIPKEWVDIIKTENS
jgi:hypothetical protein